MATKITMSPPASLSLAPRSFKTATNRAEPFFSQASFLHAPDNIPDEAYLINNLNLLHEDGAFSDIRLLRWHIGFLMGVVEAGGRA